MASEVNDVQFDLPMLVTFVDGKPVILQNTKVQLKIAYQDFLLYVRVMKMYVNACYHGTYFDLNMLDELWPQIYKKISDIVEEFPNDKNDLSEICKKMLTMFDKCCENIRTNINEDLSFVYRILHTIDVKLPKQLNKDKQSVFTYLWDLTDRLLFIDCVHVFAPVSLSLLLLTKLAVAKHCVIQQPLTSSVEICVNWSASFLVNFITNSDIVFDSLLRCVIQPKDLDYIKTYVKRELESERIMPRIQREHILNKNVVYNWTCKKYLNIKNNTTKQMRTRIINEIAYCFGVNTRIASSCELWVLLESCFPKVLSNDVRCISEIETFKYFTDKDIVKMLRIVREKLCTNNVKMIDNNNIDEIFDAQILDYIISILSAMLTKPSTTHKTIIINNK